MRKKYSHQRRTTSDEDPVLKMWGAGKEIWKDEGGDAFIARERADLNENLERKEPKRSRPADSMQERV